AAGAGLHALASNPTAARRARGALGFAALAALGLVLEILAAKEHLFSGGPDEGGPTVHAAESLVLELHHYLFHSPLLSRHPGGMPKPRRTALSPAPRAGSARPAVW